MKSKTFRLGKLSFTVDWVLVPAFVISTVVGTDAILTTIDNVRTAAPWWHTAFTAVESVVFVTAFVCCILRALQPGRSRFYHWVLFVACLVILVRQLGFEYERLVVPGDPNVLSWAGGLLSLIGWGVIGYVAWPGRAANKKEQI